ncbi:MAG: carboxypeptidase regulatory-like domain-containing protein, partial [Bacteroidales bacterium]|nr:carboxypeptidase regulatory-like domain-containing protein [Bacteroidales bacterium]
MQLKLIFLSVILGCLFIYINVSAQDQSRILPPDLIKKNLAEKPVPESGNLCIPEYGTGCSMGDGFTDFAIAEIENYNSNCADNTGYDGWSEYLELGPAMLLPGNSYDCFMQTGYADQYVTIWIDFNDDFVLTSDEKVLIDYVMQEVGVLYTASVAIPADAQPGLHIMRARTNWQNSASDPCNNYSYGEAEDYMVMVGEAAFGAMSGMVSHLTGGDPVDGATIYMAGDFTNYEFTTGSSGIYLIENIYVGDYDVTCTKEGYNIETTTVSIEEDELLTQNFQLTHPEINVNPLSLEVELEQNQIETETLNIQNDGDGELYWSASVVITNNSDDLYDLQFQYPVSGGGGEAGIESDGTNIYTTKWNGAQILKYDLEGNLLETFTIPGVVGLRDLAYDGTYFYGSAGIPVLFEMDFETKTLISSITSPVNIRAIGYNENIDAFYVNNWSDPVTIIDKSGNTLGSFNTGPIGENYYGFAYDDSTPGGPYLWGYGQTGTSQNHLIQMQLPSGTETGFTINMAEKLTGTLYNPAGGLFMEPNLEYGKWTLGGLVQNQFIWGLDMGDSQTWLNISPNSGTLAAGSNSDIEVEFNSTDLEEGAYEAQIQFTSQPDVGTPVVDVMLTVYSIIYHPDNLQISANCTDLNLSWEMAPAGGPDPDSYNIYRDDVLIANVTEQIYTDALLVPETTYSYEITAMFGVDESMPSPAEEVEVQMPENLGPTNLHIEFIGGDPYLVFDPPTGCLDPDGFNLYRDGDLVGAVSSPVPIEWGLYEYIVTAIYYFGESGPSNAVVITGSAEHSVQGITIYPNPASDKVLIQTEMIINKVELYDHLGRCVSSIDKSVDFHKINVSGFDSGLYFLKIET